MWRFFRARFLLKNPLPLTELISPCQITRVLSSVLLLKMPVDIHLPASPRTAYSSLFFPLISPDFTSLNTPGHCGSPSPDKCLSLPSVHSELSFPFTIPHPPLRPTAAGFFSLCPSEGRRHLVDLGWTSLAASSKVLFGTELGDRFPLLAALPPK